MQFRLLVVVFAVLAAAFHQQSWPQNMISHRIISNKKHNAQSRLYEGSFGREVGVRRNLKTIIATSSSSDTATNQAQTVQEKKAKHAAVLRTAARMFNATTSMPSSREYTTRKDERRSIQVSFEGVVDDYNHYRTVALKGTPNRAISILTEDVMNMLKSAYPGSEPGDLGENIWIHGMSFRQFVIGQQYEFSSYFDSNQPAVIVEITEPMIPCANLCKLSWINSVGLDARERIARCQGLLDFLDTHTGMRGWYAKIIQPGIIRVGDRVAPVRGITI
jgi:MOSC domain-containing protein YiiM